MNDPTLLRDVLIYLTAAVVCVPFAKRLGLGAVLGYLIAGSAIGPWGMRLISEVESILHFSEFGVVLMLFLIGLDLDGKRLLAMRRAVFGGGAAQMLLTGAALTLGLMVLGLPWQTALVAGAALAMSSTAIAMQTMAERALINAPVGQGAFAVLLFQDMAAIPLIAMVPLLGGVALAKGDGHGWIEAARAIVAVGGLAFIGRYLTRPLMRLIALADVREIFTAFALLLVIGIAQLMSFAGLSMALGAFLAGVLLASSEYRHALETDIAPFKGLLLGLFFIAVGMSIDFDLVLAQPLLLAELVVGLLVLKSLALAAVARIVGVPGRQRWLFAALLSQGGEFAFVVFGVAQKAHVLSDDWNALLIAAVALSMACTPLLILAHEWLAARGARTAKRDADAIDGGNAPVMHHIAFEVRDFSHLQNACDVLGQKKIPINWGPARLGPGHNVAVFHRNHDDWRVEFYAELDQMKDEELGYWDPRPWHRDQPQRPKVWDSYDVAFIWGLPPSADFMRRKD